MSPPKPSERTRGRLYASYVTTLGTGAESGSADAVLAHYTVPHFPPRPDARVLDAGCGPGALVDVLRRRGYTAVRGIDTSEEQIDLSRARGVRRVERADLWDHLEASSERCDTIFALDVVEHFDRDEVLPLVVCAMR